MCNEKLLLLHQNYINASNHSLQMPIVNWRRYQKYVQIVSKASNWNENIFDNFTSMPAAIIVGIFSMAILRHHRQRRQGRLDGLARREGSYGKVIVVFFKNK